MGDHWIMIDSKKVKKAVEWYSQNKHLYEALAKKVESVVEEILESRNLNYHSITSRVKSIPRYKEKASKDKFKDPKSEIFDMAGIRVTTYTDNDAKRVHKIVEESFELHPTHSIDKSKELGVNRVGYRSIHCVGTLGKDRAKLPENQIFKNLPFEIQVRTILQHAWAEFEHDRNYRFSGVLPHDIRRRLSIVAGNLELIDREFDSIEETIDKYVKEVGEKTDVGDLSISINSKSLETYASKKFHELIGLGLTNLIADESLISELSVLGIKSLEELESIIPDDFIKRKAEMMYPGSSVYGLIRTLLLIYNAEKLLKHWKNIPSISMVIPKGEAELIISYGVDLDKLVKKYNQSIETPVRKTSKRNNTVS